MTSIRNQGKNPEPGCQPVTAAFDEHVRRMRAFRQSHPRRHDPRAILFIRLPVLRASGHYREKGGVRLPPGNLLALAPGPETILPKGSSN